MSALTNILGNNKRVTIIRPSVSGKPSSLSFDVMDKESFKSDSEPTQHPIEEGASITDHVILKPKTLSIEGIISETPMTLGASLQGALTSVSSQIGQKIGGSIGTVAGGIGGGLAGKSLAGLVDQTNSSGTDRLLSAIKELEAIRETKLPVNIQTGLALYKNYLLKSFSVERNKTTGKSIRISCEFIECVVVSSQTVAATPSIKKAVSKKNAGAQTKQAISDNQAQSASLLVKGLGLN